MSSINKNDEESHDSINKWKTYVISVLFILAGLTMWSAYLIVNGALSFLKIPISKNILDDFSIICVLYFVGVFIALALHYNILDLNKIWPKFKTKSNNQETKKKRKFKEYIWSEIKILLITPLLSTVILYYIIYLILYISLGIIPYLVSITMIAGLILSVLKMSKMVYGENRGKKIIYYSTFVLLGYVFTLFMIYYLKPKSEIYMKQSVIQTTETSNQQ